MTAKLFALSRFRSFGIDLARHAGLRLANHEEREFEDGEFKIRPLESVRGERVILCETLIADALIADASSSVPRLSANDRLVRLLFLIGAIRDAGAAEVAALVPYLAYARKDRRTKARDPVSTRYVAALFEAMGLDLLVTLEVHNPAAFDNAFRCRTLHLESAPLLAKHCAAMVNDAQRVVVLSPDTGGVKRARRFADCLAEKVDVPVELAFMEKQRSEGRVSGTAFAGDVAGASVIVYDDMICGGTTTARAAQACYERGARVVHACAAHGAFSDSAESLLREAGVASVVVTDSVGSVRERAARLDDRLAIVSCIPLFAEELKRISTHRR